MLMSNRTLVILCALTISSVMAFAHSHTHIGRNQDGVWNTEDDNTLWFFSVPGTTGWPNWGEPLQLVYQDSGPLAGKYVCEALYCWHSAHPSTGLWQLGGSNSANAPDWQIAIERVSFDEGFAMTEYDTYTPVLTSDGATYELPQMFMEDKYNENGELGAWGFHYHLLFVAEADGAGETFNATFKALDFGTTGYSASDNYTISFVTVPEPLTMAVLGMSGLFLISRRIR